MSGENCSSRCTTKDHKSFGECLRAKGLQIGRADADKGKAWDRELEAYRSAREQGIQPNSTKMRDIQAAVEVSNKHGMAFGTDFGQAPSMGD